MLSLIQYALLLVCLYVMYNLINVVVTSMPMSSEKYPSERDNEVVTSSTENGGFNKSSIDSNSKAISDYPHVIETTVTCSIDASSVLSSSTQVVPASPDTQHVIVEETVVASTETNDATALSISSFL